MKIRRLLILVPALVVAVLVQSLLWVPTYESQSAGNAGRLEKFIEASIGDAKILNPILNADTSSSRIVDLVFDGLLDLDETLALRARLATDWKITETAYLLVDPTAHFTDGTPVSAAVLIARIEALLEREPELGEVVVALDVVPPEVDAGTLSVPGREGSPETVAVEVAWPERIRIELNRVEQNLLARLAPVIGDDYATGPNRARYVEVADPGHEAAVSANLDALVPVLEHNPEIEFELRRGVRFHDGHEFDAGDVKFTYESIMSPRNLSPRTSDFEPIKAVEVIDTHTVRVVYKRLFSPAINAWTMGILPEHLLNDATLAAEAARRGLSRKARESFGLRDASFNRAPIGTGPFRFVQWQSDELIHLRRNESYWDGAPLYHDYYYRIIPESMTQEVEFRTGAVDTYTPQPYQVARYAESPQYQVFSSLRFGFSYIGYNNRRELFSDARTRTALGMALNVDEIIRYVLYGEGQRVTGPFPPATPWYDHGVEPLPYDPDAAREELARLGWQPNADGWLEKDGKPFEFNLITNNGNPIRKAILTIAQNSWRRIGVKCNTQVFEWAVFLQDFVNPGDFDAVVLGWSMGIDPDLYQIWHSSQSGPNQLNFVGFRNEEANRLIERIRREYDASVQRELTHRLHRIIAREQPYTFLFAPRATRVLDRKIVMVEPDGRYAPVRASRSGDVFFHMNRWTKLDHAPEF